MTSLDFGTTMLGGNVFGWTADRQTSFDILDAFVAGGGRAIDTADGYSKWVPGNKGGESETIIGEWLEKRGKRDDLVIATKVFTLPSRPGLSPENTAAAIDESLARLQTDYVDVYYAHYDDPEVPQEEMVAGFDALVKAGKVREVGASNFTSDRLRSAVKIATDGGLTPFTIAQDQWNLVERGIEAEYAPLLAELGIVELPYYSLASGYLSGKYRPGKDVPGDRSARTAKYVEQHEGLIDLLEGIASVHNTTVAAVSLAWLRAQPVVGAPIASASRVDQVAGLLEKVKLEDDEIEKLSVLSQQ